MVENPKNSSFLFLVNSVTKSFSDKFFHGVDHFFLHVHQPYFNAEPHTDYIAEFDTFVFRADHSINRRRRLLFYQHLADSFKKFVDMFLDNRSVDRVGQYFH